MIFSRCYESEFIRRERYCTLDKDTFWERYRETFDRKTCVTTIIRRSKWRCQFAKWKNSTICLIFLTSSIERSIERSPRYILNPVISLLIASASQRIYPYQRTTFRRTEDLFSVTGNGNSASGEFQWLFLTFDPARPVAGCPSTIYERYPALSTTHPMYNWRAAKFAPYQCKIRACTRHIFDIFLERNIFRSDAISFCSVILLCFSKLFLCKSLIYSDVWKDYETDGAAKNKIFLSIILVQKIRFQI